jgi:hypothetical protein
MCTPFFGTDRSAAANASRAVPPPLPLPTVHLGSCSGRILGGETVTSSRVGHTGARITLADASYHKVHSSRFGAGHRVGIQNAPAGAPLSDSPIHDGPRIALVMMVPYIDL